MFVVSRPLKTIFQHKVCIDKLYADSFYKVQKNSHSFLKLYAAAANNTLIASPLTPL